MTIEDINLTYLNHYGLAVKSGRGIEPILPYLLMDIAYQMYNKYIAPLDVKFELNREKKKWLTTYRTFNSTLFRVFDESEYDEITDIMDEFESYIKNDVDLTFIAVQSLMMDDPLELRKVVAAGTVINILAYNSAYFWYKLYGNIHKWVDGFNYLKTLEKSSFDFVNKYHQKYSNIDIDPNGSEQLNVNSKVLSLKIRKWLEKVSREMESASQMPNNTNNQTQQIKQTSTQL